MSDWREIYKSRLVSAEEAVKAIKPGNRVVLGHACGEPRALVQALLARGPELEEVEIVHLLKMGQPDFCLPEMASRLRSNALFVSGANREAVRTGRADYTPCFFSEVPRLFRQGYLPVDAALVQVSPPDKHGFCSFGVSVDYTKSGAESARLVIAQVNRHMPRTLGNCFIHVSQFDYIVEADIPLYEVPRANLSAEEEMIGHYVAELVEDGSTLQLGIGAIPEAALLFMKDKKDLGIHTEMFSDAVVEAYHRGIITNRLKTINPGKIIATFLMGTKALYDFVDDNPAVEMHPVDYSNDIFVISRHEKMVAINSALQVDLTGQVCADTIGRLQYSGVGGQVDFVRGASRSPGGKAIIAMPATAAQGKISRIVPLLDPGAAVTTSRNDVHYVVTEYGIADLRGKTLRQRALALTAIAHPQFREELRKEMQVRGLD